MSEKQNQGYRSKIMMRYPFAIRFGRSKDGKWDFQGKRLGFAGAKIQRDATGACLIIWLAGFAVWIARAKRSPRLLTPSQP